MKGKNPNGILNRKSTFKRKMDVLSAYVSPTINFQIKLLLYYNKLQYFIGENNVYGQYLHRIFCEAKSTLDYNASNRISILPQG